MVRVTACSWLLCILGCGLIVASPPVSHQDSERQLVLDERVIATRDSVELVQGEVAKHPGNPLFPADKPWENSLNNGYPNIVFDPAEERFQLWYKCVLADAEAIAKLDPPRTVHNVGWLLLYATSRDGVKWERPALGLHKFDGSAANNAVTRDTPNVGVFRDTNPACPADRRYKMVFDTGLGKIQVCFSADGIHWSDSIATEGLGARAGDTHNNAFWDERLRKYVLLTRLVLGERLVARAESDDFIHWTPATVALRSSIAEGRERQTYCLPAFPYGAGYLGFVMMYNVARDKSVDCELAWSPDAIHWRRPFAGQPFIPRGAEGAYDSKCIYAQAGSPVLKDGKLHIYYGGDDDPHIGWKRHCLPCLATLRPDGFAGYRAREEGCVTTQPLLLSQREVRVSADAERGAVTVTALIGDDVIAESDPLSGDISDAVVKWKAGASLERHVGRAVRLRFTLRNATLFSFHGLKQLSTVTVTPETRQFVAVQEVSLTAPATAEIRYTLDGSEPTATSAKYERPLTLERSTVLKTAAVSEAGLGPSTSAGFVKRAPWTGPRTTVKVVADFTSGVEGWKGVDKNDVVTHDADGFIRLRRDGAIPYLTADGATPFAGDWPAKFGGNGVRIEFRHRASKSSPRTTVEIFAKNIAQWSCSGLPGAETTWTDARVELRHDWSDAEAIAAGWRPAPNAFSWRDTLRNMQRMTIYPHAIEAESFDLDDVWLTTFFD